MIPVGRVMNFLYLLLAFVQVSQGIKSSHECVFIQIKAQPSVPHDSILLEVFSLGQCKLQVWFSNHPTSLEPTLFTSFQRKSLINKRIWNLKILNISCHFNLHKSSKIYANSRLMSFTSINENRSKAYKLHRKLTQNYKYSCKPKSSFSK